MLFIILVVACIFDYRQGRIPNKLNVFGLIVAVAGMIAKGVWLCGFSGVGFLLVARSLLLGIARALGTAVVLYLLYMPGMLGAGDVKLCAIAVLFLNGKQSLVFLVTGFLVAGGMALVKMLYSKNLRERFCYFLDYVAEVWRSKKLSLYFEGLEEKEKKQASLHMAGPLLAGLLFCLWKWN